MDRLQRILIVSGSVSAALLALVWSIKNEPAQKPNISVASAPSAPMTQLKVQQGHFQAKMGASTAPSLPKAASDPSQARNPGIAPQELSYERLSTAQNFLRQVTVLRDPRGGFVVQDVDAGSIYAALGLRVGDRIFSVDTPATEGADDESIDDAMSQQHVELQIYRSEGFVLLKYAL